MTFSFLFEKSPFRLFQFLRFHFRYLRNLIFFYGFVIILLLLLLSFVSFTFASYLRKKNSYILEDFFAFFVIYYPYLISEFVVYVFGNWHTCNLKYIELATKKENFCELGLFLKLLKALLVILT